MESKNHHVVRKHAFYWRYDTPDEAEANAKAHGPLRSFGRIKARPIKARAIAPRTVRAG